MYKVVLQVQCSAIANSEEVVEEWEFETLEEAQEFMASYPADDVYQAAVDNIGPEGWLEIQDEDGETVEKN